MNRRVSKIIILALALAVSGSGAFAQKKKPARQARPSQAQLAKDHAKAKEDVIKASNEYKESIQQLIVLLEAEEKSAADIVEKRKALLAANVISKRELEDSERALELAQTKIATARKQIGEADSIIAEAKAEDQIAKLPPIPRGGYRTTAALIRFNGAARWVLSDASKVQSFYASRFGRQLPISAYGQTGTHNRMGFNHSNSIDVAVHPDSFEGMALMSYLRSAGIPFIAFRQAVAGSATGAHIHIGYPSSRIR